MTKTLIVVVVVALLIGAAAVLAFDWGPPPPIDMSSVQGDRGSPQRESGPDPVRSKTGVNTGSYESASGPYIRVGLVVDAKHGVNSFKNIAVYRGGKLRGTLTTDSEGNVYLTKGRPTTFLFYSEGAYHGELEITRQSPDSVTLIVREVEGIPVRVVDKSGRGASRVPVALVQLVGGKWVILGQSTTNEVGLCRVPTHRIGRDVLQESNLIVGALLRTPVRVPVGSRGLLRETVVIEIPAIGELHVRVSGLPRWNPRVPIGGSLGLNPGDVSDQHPCRIKELADVFGNRRQLAPGTTVFRNVEVGIAVDVRVWAPFLPGQDRISLRCTGPISVSVPAVFDVDLTLPSIRGRLLGSDESVCSNMRLRYRFHYGFGDARRSKSVWNDLKTDADGAFEVTQTQEWQELRGVTVTTRSMEILVRYAFPKYSDCTIDLPARMPRGSHDIGTVSVPVREKIAVGRVVRASDGVGVEGATVAVETKTDQNPRWTKLFDDSERKTLRSVSDSNGNFELYGVLNPKQEFRVVAEMTGFVSSKPQDLPARRAEGITLQLERAGDLHGKILVDPGIPVQKLSVRLRAQGSEMWDETAVAADASFRFECLPGVHDLEVRIAQTREVVRSHPGVVVTLKPRSRVDLDLRGRLCCFDVQVVDGDKPLGGATVVEHRKKGAVFGQIPAIHDIGSFVTLPELGGWGGSLEQEEQLVAERWRETWATTRIQVLSFGPAIDLRIGAPGKRRKVLRAVQTNQRIELVDGLEVVARIQPKPKVPHGYSIRGFTSRRAEGGAYPPRFVFDKGGRAVFKISDDTAVGVRFKLALVSNDGKKGAFIKHKLSPPKKDGQLVVELLEDLALVEQRLK